MPSTCSRRSMFRNRGLDPSKSTHNGVHGPESRSLVTVGGGGLLLNNEMDTSPPGAANQFGLPPSCSIDGPREVGDGFARRSDDHHDSGSDDVERDRLRRWTSVRPLQPRDSTISTCPIFCSMNTMALVPTV